MRSFITITFLLLSLFGLAQSKQELVQMSQVAPVPEHQDAYYLQYVGENASEYELVFSTLFIVYKAFFSSQDASNCSFTPSCSVYAIQAIRKQGPVIGLVNFFDRFSRCNGLSPEHYERHAETQLLYDPL